MEAVLVNCTPSTLMRDFQTNYRNIHVNICLIICPLGVFSNLMNVIILNQKVMQSPTNFLLTILAITDGLLMAFYIPFALYFLKENYLRQSSYHWAMYMMVYVIVQNILHVISIGIIVALATFRVLYIRCLVRCNELCNITRAYISVIAIVAIAVLLSIPHAIAHKVIPICMMPNSTEIEEEYSESNSKCVKYNRLYRVNYVDNPTIRKILFWVSAIFIKLLPVVLVTILSIVIIMAIKSRAKKMSKLKSNACELKGSRENLEMKSNQPLVDKRPGKTTDKDGIRTTRMLLVIVLIFMVAYLPQVRLQEFFFTCYISKKKFRPFFNCFFIIQLMKCLKCPSA